MRCFHPYTIRNPKKALMPCDPKYIDIPCGKCLACQKNFRDEWSYRMIQEYFVSGPCFFVTLTYDPMEVPFSDYGSTCVKDHVQLFNKRLFKNVRTKFDKLRKKKVIPLDSLQPKDRHFRFFVACEYSPKLKRPHYHGIYFFPSGCDITLHEFTLECQRCWSRVEDDFPSFDDTGNPLCHSRGFVSCSFLNESRIGYATKYVTKQLLPDDFHSTWSLKSVRPPLGSHLLSNTQWCQRISHGLPLYNDKGYMIRIPRYFQSKLIKRPRFTIDEQSRINHELLQKSDLDKYTAFQNWIAQNDNEDYEQFFEHYCKDDEISMEINYLQTLKNKSSYE